MLLAVNNNIKSRWTVNLPDPHSDVLLRDSYNAYKLYLLLAKAKVDNLPCIVDLFIDEKIVFEGGNIQFEKLEQHLIDYSTTMDHAWSIAKYFDCHEDIKLVPMELLENPAILQAIYSTINNITVPISINFFSEVKKENVKKMCCPIIIRLPFGQYYVSMSMIIFGILKIVGKMNKSFIEYNINADNIEICSLVLDERSSEVMYLSPLREEMFYNNRTFASSLYNQLVMFGIFGEWASYWYHNTRGSHVHQTPIR